MIKMRINVITMKNKKENQEICEKAEQGMILKTRTEIITMEKKIENQ